MMSLFASLSSFCQSLGLQFPPQGFPSDKGKGKVSPTPHFHILKTYNKGEGEYTVISIYPAAIQGQAAGHIPKGCIHFRATHSSGKLLTCVLFWLCRDPRPYPALLDAFVLLF
jgi:hypothetical protein